MRWFESATGCDRQFLLGSDISVGFASDLTGKTTLELPFSINSDGTGLFQLVRLQRDHALSFSREKDTTFPSLCRTPLLALHAATFTPRR